MHLTDYREQCLKDVITQLEPGLFKKVTGLSVKDFELLVSLGVFRDSVMNDAVYKFRLYEGALLEYTGLNRHEYDSNAGLFDTTLFAEDYAQMKLQDSLLNPDGTTRDRNNAMVVASEIAGARDGSAGDGEKPRRRVQVLDLGGSRDSASAPRETKAMSGTPSKRDWVYDALADEGLELIDARGKDGCLWVVGGGELENQGARFEFSLRDSKATGGRFAWWLRGFPEMTVPEWSEPRPSLRRSSTLWSRETPFSTRLSAAARSWASTAGEEPSRSSSDSTRRASRSTASSCSRTCSSRAC